MAQRTIGREVVGEVQSCAQSRRLFYSFAFRLLHSARNERIQDLLINTILDPQQARILLTKATPENAPTLMQRLAKRMTQTGIASARAPSK